MAGRRDNEQGGSARGGTTRTGPPAALAADSRAAAAIFRERYRQMEDENWTPQHDDEHDRGELVGAAIAYAAHAMYERADYELPNDFWPDGWEFKPSPDPIRNLVKAGALIAAEIDRLHRRERLCPGRPTMVADTAAAGIGRIKSQCDTCGLFVEVADGGVLSLHPRKAS